MAKATATTDDIKVEDAKPPYVPGYWGQWLFAPDPAYRAEWPVGPWPVPWFRGLHSWSMWFSTDPKAGPGTSLGAPWVSVFMGLAEVFIMLVLAWEYMVPLCSGDNGHSDCPSGMFCSVADVLDESGGPKGGICYDCEYARKGTDLWGKALEPAMTASAADYCIDDDPDVCDVLMYRRITVASYMIGIFYLLLFPMAIIRNMEKAANEELMLDYRLQKHGKALGWRAFYTLQVSYLSRCIRNCVIPPVLALTTATFLAGQQKFGAKTLTIAFVTFTSILRIDEGLLYLFVNGRSFDDAAFKADLADARKQAPFIGLSLAAVGRRAFGFLAVIYIFTMVNGLNSLSKALLGSSNCSNGPFTLMGAACLLVLLHGGTLAIGKPLLEKPKDEPITAAMLGILVVRAVGGVVMGIGVFVGMFYFTLELHGLVAYI